ncbi:leucine-rich repeat extensin-like protein 7 [Iris pallida]|uniref:Leucine-rich repeat extensin-like protein 7 n=1 Tax=Iris pallida TaxID=29817 RepID=A0AAX6HRL7_IRIPA|nr:leucine-rich repeat extensin-like protein 7 [Iris pallida]
MTTLTISRPFFPTLATAPPFPNHQQPPNCRISPTPVMTPLVSQPPHCYAWTRHLFNCLDHPVFPIDHHRTKYTIPWFNLHHHINRRPPFPSAKPPRPTTSRHPSITATTIDRPFPGHIQKLHSRGRGRTSVDLRRRPRRARRPHPTFVQQTAQI